jgi:hypothetical protein
MHLRSPLLLKTLTLKCLSYLTREFIPSSSSSISILNSSLSLDVE